MSQTFSSQLWTLTQSRMISGKTHLVLQALASFEGPHGLFPSHEAIAARAGCSARTVIRSLEKAYLLGLVERTRRRVKRQGRMVSGSNLYRLVLKPLEQAKVAARHYAQQLREALARRKQRFLQTDIFAAETYSKEINRPYPRHTRDEWLEILTRMQTGQTPQEAGYRGKT